MPPDPAVRTPASQARRASARRVQRRGWPEAPVPVSDEALFAKDTPIRMVHADIVAMMVGGIRGLLLQMLHPHALQGVLDHSNFRSDMHGRLRRTARFIAVTTFGHRDDAQAAIERVNRIHAAVGARCRTGRLFRQQPACPGMGPRRRGDQLPRRLSAPCAARYARLRARRILSPVRGGRSRARRGPGPARPARSRHDLPRLADRSHRLTRRTKWPISCCGSDRKAHPLPVQAMLGAEAVALLPPFARSMLGLERPGLAALPARAATWGWARPCAGPSGNPRRAAAAARTGRQRQAQDCGLLRSPDRQRLRARRPRPRL